MTYKLFLLLPCLAQQLYCIDSRLHLSRRSMTYTVLRIAINRVCCGSLSRNTGFYSVTLLFHIQKLISYQNNPVVL